MSWVPRIRLYLPRLTREEIAEHHEELALLDPPYLDGAIVGIAERPGLVAVLYSADRCIKLMAKHNGWTQEEAAEFFYYNTARAYIGPASPLFI